MSTTTTSDILTQIDVSAWASKDEVPPRDLFASVDQYCEFVRAWKAHYKDVSIIRRYNKLSARIGQTAAVAKYATEWNSKIDEWNKNTKFQHRYAKRFVPVPKAWKVERLARLEKLIPGYPVDSGYGHVIWMMNQRCAGKKWARAHGSRVP